MSFFGEPSPAAAAPAVKAPSTTVPSARAPSAKPQTEVKDYPKENTLGTCCIFFLFLWFTPISMVFCYHAAPTTVISLFIVWNLCALSPWAFHAGGAIGSDISGPLLTLSLFASVSLSFLHGVRCYYHHSQPMRQLALSREYQGVYPELPAMAFPDAAYVEFVDNTTIDFTKAMSYQSLDSGLSTFCVAPIVTKASTGRHDFWAIGVDCCDPGGTTKDKFRCYDAGDPDVKTGWVLPTQFGDALYSTLGRYVSPAEGRRDLFVKAVQKAESVHGIVSPGEKAIFVRWTKTKKEDILFFQFIGVLVTVVISGAILAGMSFGMTRLFQRFTYVQRSYHRALRESQGGGDDVSARPTIRQFLNDAFEDAQDGDMGGTIQRMQGTSMARLAAKHHKPPDPKDMCLMTIVIPYILLMLCVVLCTFSPCSRFGHLVVAPLFCMTLIFVLALLATPGRAVNGLFILLCCTAGYYIGITNYKQNMFNYCSTSDRRIYQEVPAAANTANYWDAGALRFDASTMLSTYHSVGFLYQGTTYCAAPVIARNAPCKDSLAAPQQAHGQVAAPPNVTGLWQTEVDHVMALAATEKARFDTFEEFADSEDHHVAPPSFMQQRFARHRSLGAHKHHSRTAASVPASEAAAGGCQKPAPTQIEFWAIGVDCCDARKRFWCDGGDVENAKEAVVIRAFGDEDSDGPKIRSDRGHFFQAIDQAVAAYELPVPDRPVLLRWGPSATELNADWKRHAVGIIGLTGLASLIAILVVGVISYFFLRHLHRQALKEMEDYEATAGSTTGYDGAPSPRPSLPPATQGGEDEVRF